MAIGPRTLISKRSRKFKIAYSASFIDDNQVEGFIYIFCSCKKNARMWAFEKAIEHLNMAYSYPALKELKIKF